MLMTCSTIPCPLLSDVNGGPHFHAFMIDVHKRVHAVKTTAGPYRSRGPDITRARDLANESSVLCFDDFRCGENYSPAGDFGFEE